MINPAILMKNLVGGINKNVFLLFLLLLFAACTKEGDTIYLPDPNEPTLSKAPLVTVVYDTEGIGDLGYNDLIFVGVERAAANFGLQTLHLTPESLSEGQGYLETAIQHMTSTKDTIRRLLIVASPVYDDFIRKNNQRLAGNPHADLLFLETRNPLDGKGSSLYISYYGAMYEAGALSPYVAEKALIVGANPKNESVATAIKGFSDGAASCNMPLALQTFYLSQEIDGGFSIADTTALHVMKNFSQSDSQMLLVPICGGASHTFGRLVQLTYSYLLMGIDRQSESNYYSPLSAVKHIDRAVAQCIEQWLSVEGMPKHQAYGLASGYTEVVLHPMDSEIKKSLETLTQEKKTEIHDEAVRKEQAHEK